MYGSVGRKFKTGLKGGVLVDVWGPSCQKLQEIVKTRKIEEVAIMFLKFCVHFYQKKVYKLIK